MMNKALFTCKSDDWSTPSEIYEYFMAKGCFDPCPLYSSFDGLSIDWKQRNFVNPPYSKLALWIDKAIQEAEKGRVSYLLIPARTDTKNFEKLWNYRCNFFFLKGRLKFGGSSSSAPFPSMIVFVSPLIIFPRYCQFGTFKDLFLDYGKN